MKYKTLDGIATADVAYKVYGETLKELFGNSAEVVTQTMVDLTTVKSVVSCQLSVVSSKLEDLLLDFLNEIVFYKDSQQLLFSQFKVKISPTPGVAAGLPRGESWSLKAELLGEKVDIKKHKLRCDVKAVTRHKFFLKKEKGKYVAQIVLDI